MLDALFRFFFELSPVVFSQGEFRFAASTGSYVAAAAVAVAAGADDRRVSQGPRPPEPARHARGDPPRDPRHHPGLHVPAAARGAGRGAAAEFPRRAAGRFAQHADRGCRRPAARIVREERVRRHRSRAAEGAVGALHGPHVPLFERGDAHDAGKRPDLRRIAVAPRRGAVGRAPGAGRPAGRGPGDGERRRRHRGRGARRSDPRTQGRRPAGLHRSASGARRCRKTSRSAASSRRRPRSRARR